MRPFVLLACIALAFACLLASVPATISHQKPKAVLLKDVQSLVFTKDALTQARRSSSIQQMTCIKGPCQYAPSTALCKNIGFDGVDVNWQCEAELPKGVKLTSATVSCEGFAHADDPYVLAGSCGLEYSLEGVPLYTEEARAPLPAQVPHNWWHHPIQNAKSAANKAADSLWYSTPLGWVWNEWNKPRGVNAHAHPTHHHQHPYVPQYAPLYDDSWSLLPSLGSLISLTAIGLILYSIYKSVFPSASISPTPHWPLSAFYNMLSSSQQPPAYGASHKAFESSAGYHSAASSSGTSGFLSGLLGGVLGYMMGSRRQPQYPANAAHSSTFVPSAAWGNLREATVARDNGYSSRASRPVNQFPEMPNDSISAPVRVNEAAAPGEKIVAERSVREDQAVTGAEVNTTETSRAFGTTKRR